MRNIILSFLFFLSGYLVLSDERMLYPITDNGKLGYINEYGNVVIDPIYLSGGEFNEGLAPVRLNGKYGFINQAGQFSIAPEYDYASDFNKGWAVVYKNGQQLFIDRQGRKRIDDAYKSVIFLSGTRGAVETYMGKNGIINLLTGELLVDTVFDSMSSFDNGIAIVRRSKKRNQKKANEEIGVIDSAGRIVVPFGLYTEISNFSDGYAVVSMDDKQSRDGSIDGVIDAAGKLIFSRRQKDKCYLDGDFHEGVAKISLYKYWIPEEKGVYSTSEKRYEGYINLSGVIVLNDTLLEEVGDFSNGRAFVRQKFGEYQLIDRMFRKVCAQEFRNVPFEKFINGYAIVDTDDGQGIIDTLGNFVVNPEFEKIVSAALTDGYFFFEQSTSSKGPLYGFGAIGKGAIVEAQFQQVDPGGFKNGLLKVVKDDRLMYVDINGKLIWQQSKQADNGLTYLNIDYMNRGYFYAYGANTEEESGGWAKSSNTPQKTGTSAFPSNTLALTIDTTSNEVFANHYFGARLYLSNTKPDTISLNAQDSRLDIVLQAMDDNGRWRNIEYLPRSWCGNSYHELQLEPGAYWSFVIPHYRGEMKTKIRAVLTYKSKRSDKSSHIVVSNTIHASVNPGQFWNKRAYYPNGIMDPYFE
jgi:hypothetical protein